MLPAERYQVSRRMGHCFYQVPMEHRGLLDALWEAGPDTVRQQHPGIATAVPVQSAGYCLISTEHTMTKSSTNFSGRMGLITPLFLLPVLTDCCHSNFKFKKARNAAFFRCYSQQGMTLLEDSDSDTIELKNRLFSLRSIPVTPTLGLGQACEWFESHSTASWRHNQPTQPYPPQASYRGAQVQCNSNSLPLRMSSQRSSNRLHTRHHTGIDQLRRTGVHTNEAGRAHQLPRLMSLVAPQYDVPSRITHWAAV